MNLKKFFFSFFSILSIIGYGVFVFAAPPGVGGYNPGEILDPECAPGDVDCVVTLPTGGSVTADNGLTATSGNVQLGGMLNNADFYTVISGNGYTQGLEISGLDSAFFETNKDFFIQSNDRVVIRKKNGASLEVGSNINLNFGLSGALLIANAAGTSGQVLTSNGPGAAPTWETISGGGGGSSAISVNGTTLYSSGLTGTGNFNGYNIFLGTNAGNGVINTNDSNFFGRRAGYGVTNASNSNFFGYQAGHTATGAYNSNFLGPSAGYSATGAYNSNFLGYQAGQNAANANHSNFFGSTAGYSANNANNSNFFGNKAGVDADNASYSNFLGDQAGYNATNAYNSNFFGEQAGNGAVNASNSIFIGTGAGLSDTVNNTGDVNDFSILIGQSTSTGGFSNSIAIGAYATNTASNQFMIGSATRTINEVVIVGSGASCTIDNNIYGSGSTGLNCSSDERLKTNIENLESTTLDTLLNVKTVRYNWNANPTGNKSIGFLAQDLQQYFPELVKTGHDGYLQVNYGGITPILVEAIREMNLKITTINDMETPNTWRDSLIAWFGNIENGITDFFAKRVTTDELCVGTVCVTQDQFLQMVQQSGQIPVVQTPSPDPQPADTPTEDMSPDQSVTDTVSPSDTPASTENTDIETSDTPPSDSSSDTPSDSGIDTETAL